MALRMGMLWKIFIEILGLEEGIENLNCFLIIQVNSESYSSEDLQSDICFWPTKWTFFRSVVCNPNSRKIKPCFMNIVINQWHISLNKLLFNESKSWIWLFHYFKHIMDSPRRNSQLWDFYELRKKVSVCIAIARENVNKIIRIRLLKCLITEI